MMLCESKCALRSKQSEERKNIFPKLRKVKAVSKTFFSETEVAGIIGRWLADGGR